MSNSLLNIENGTSIVAKLINRFANIIERLMRCLFREPLQYIRLPSLYDFLYGTDVQIAVMEKRFEIGHQSNHEPPILADTVATHG